MSNGDDPSTETLVSSKLNINTLLVLIGLVFQAGIYFGAIQPLPGKMESGFKSTNDQIASLSAKVSGLDFGLQQTQKDIGTVNGRILSVESQNEQQWEAIRAAALTASSAMQRDDFLEWKADYSKKNPSAEVPVLPKTVH